MARTRSMNQQGVILLSVLLIVALLAAVSYRLVERQTVVIAQAQHSFGGATAMSYAIGAEDFARQILFEDWSTSGPGSDNLTEAWAQPLEPFELPEFEDSFLEVNIKDLHSCFNLNSLAGADAKDNHNRLKNLMRNITVPDTLADAWLDWVDPDEQVTNFGAEDGDYLLAEIPHRTANSAAGHMSEILLLPNMEAEHFQLLKQHTCVIPNDELKLNVNTASAEVLASINPGLDANNIQSLVESARTYTKVKEITATVPELASSVDALTVTSDYFEVQVRVQINGQLSELTSVLHRDPTDGHITVHSRDFGEDFRSRFLQSDDETDGPRS